MASKVINIIKRPLVNVFWGRKPPLVKWLKNDAVSRSSTFGSELRGRVVKR